MNRWEKNPYVRKHVHRWRIVKDTPATRMPPPTYSTLRPLFDPTPRTLIRECDDCGVKQRAEVPDESVLVPGHENIADVEWRTA